MIRVYIASPYTNGDVAVNVKLQLDVAEQLITLGFAPFAPLYYHFQHMAHPRPYTDWMTLCLEWLPVCNCVLRLGGKSPGAEQEVSVAEQIGLPVFYSIDSLRHYYGV